MSLRKTTEEFKNEVEKLTDNKLTIISEYINNRTNIMVKCNICNHIFTRYPGHLINGRDKCPMCFKERSTRQKTTEEFKKDIFNKFGDEYTVLGEYVNNKTKILMRHNTCGNEYTIEPHYILNQNNKCPYCFKNTKKTTEQFKQEIFNLVGDEYTVLGEYVNNKTKILMRHNTCGNEWYITPVEFLVGNNRCPKEKSEKISKSETFSKEEYIESLRKRFGGNLVDEFEIISDYINNDTNIIVRHKKCGYEYSVRPYNFLKNTYCQQCATSTNSSKFEIEVYNFIKSIYNGKIIRSYKIMENNKRCDIDIYLPDENIGIECDGLYWHSTKYKDSGYHLTKTKKCKEKNIFLIHLFEDEWVNKQNIVKSRILNLLKLSNIKIYARNCYIEEISYEYKKEFLDTNHIQGNDVSSINLGLWYPTDEGDILVSVMTFCKPRISLNISKKEYDYELSRFANEKGYNVIGGFSKLFKYFERNYEWNSIITYADRRWSQGDVYLKNGFTLDHISKPNYWYFKYRGTKPIRYHRFNFPKYKLREIFPESYDENLTEKEIMAKENYQIIYDCGNYVFYFNK